MKSTDKLGQEEEEEEEEEEKSSLTYILTGAHWEGCHGFACAVYEGNYGHQSQSKTRSSSCQQRLLMYYQEHLLYVLNNKVTSVAIAMLPDQHTVHIEANKLRHFIIKTYSARCQKSSQTPGSALHMPIAMLVMCWTSAMHIKCPTHALDCVTLQNCYVMCVGGVQYSGTLTYSS